MDVNVGALLIFRTEGVNVTDVEEELIMLNLSVKNVFTSVATGAVASPLIASKNWAVSPHAVTISCYQENLSPAIRALFQERAGLTISLLRPANETRTEHHKDPNVLLTSSQSLQATVQRQARGENND